VEIAEVEEGRSLEPTLDQIEERRLLLRSLDTRGILCAQARRVGRGVQLKAVLAPHSQLVLDQAKLSALKARGRDQIVAEIEEVERSHGLQNVDLLNQNPLDLDDAPATEDRLPEFLLRDGRASKGREHRVEFPQDLFEPQLVSLMNDDEEHLVVCRPAGEGALHLLAAKQPIELDVVRVIERSAGLYFSHLGSLRTRMRSEEHTSELQSLAYLVCRLLLEKKKKINNS